MTETTAKQPYEEIIPTRFRAWLFVGGLMNIIFGFVHVAIVFLGPWAYEYFGAGYEMTQMAREGSLIPPLVTLFIAGIFWIFGLYGLSGSGRYRQLPLMVPVLWVIAIVYTLRGLFIIPQFFMQPENTTLPANDYIYSAVALFIGFCYLAGARGLTKRKHLVELP